MLLVDIWVTTQILVLITNVEKPSINLHVVLSRESSGLNFGLTIFLHLYFMHTSSCADSPEPLLLPNLISTKISLAGPYISQQLHLVKILA